MKKLAFVSLVFVSINSFAASTNLSLDSYCRIASEKRELSQLALSNEGRISSVDPRTQNNKIDYFRGCRYDTSWINTMYLSLCNGAQAKSTNDLGLVANTLKAPKTILYFFDGAGDFNARYAADTIKPVNIDGSEGVDLGMGNANGLTAISNMVSNSQHELAKHKNEIEFHYHPGSGFKQRENYASATACAEDSKYYLDVLNNIQGREKVDTKWIIMGYSNGGLLSIDFQNDLTKFGVNADLTFTIDPIVQTAQYVFHKLMKTIGKKNDSTKRFVNLYQQTDIDSLPGFKLRGKPVVNADVNFMLTPENTRELAEDGNFNHVRIVGSRIVSDTVSCEIGKIFNTKASRCAAAESVLNSN